MRKAITFAERLNMPVIGVVENMSGFVCPHCGEKTEIFQSAVAKKWRRKRTFFPWAASLLIQKSVLMSDKGTPFVIAHKDSAAAKAFVAIVGKVAELVK